MALLRGSQPKSVKRSILEKTMSTIVQGAMELIGLESGIVRLVNRAKTQITDSYEFPEGFEHPPSRFPQPASLTWKIIQEGQMIAVPDITKDKRVNPEMVNKEIKALVGVPFTVEGETVGALFLNDHETHEFTDYEKELLSTLAGHAAVAIKNLRQRRAQTQAIEEIAKSIAATSPLKEVWKGILDSTLSLMGEASLVRSGC